jgi:hypothetical protein
MVPQKFLGCEPVVFFNTLQAAAFHPKAISHLLDF